jgi:hypothetical protein
MINRLAIFYVVSSNNQIDATLVAEELDPPVEGLVTKTDPAFKSHQLL